MSDPTGGLEQDRTTLDSGITGGRSHEGRQPDDTMVTTGGNGYMGGGAHHLFGESMKRSDPDDLGGCDGAVMTTARVGSRDLEGKG